MFDDVVTGIVSVEQESMTVPKETALISNSVVSSPLKERLGGGELTRMA